MSIADYRGSSIIPITQYHYTQIEEQKMTAQAVKANTECKSQKQQLNMCRALIENQVNPDMCIPKSFDLINCFQKIGDNCNKELQIFIDSKGDKNTFDQYINCKQ